MMLVPSCPLIFFAQFGFNTPRLAAGILYYSSLYRKSNSARAPARKFLKIRDSIQFFYNYLLQVLYKKTVYCPEFFTSNQVFCLLH